MSSEESGLSRWARRKAEVRRERGGAAPAVEEEPAAQLPAESAAPEDAAAGSPEPVTPEDLPDIDSLTAESDFTVFLKEGVPQQLRRLALRKLWASDPVLANLDGLIEYGEDYTDAAMVVEGMKSAWEVGRGYAKPEPEEEDAAAETVAGMDDGADGQGEESAADPALTEETVENDSKTPDADPDLAAVKDTGAGPG